MENEFSKVAALIGDTVRAKILWALLDGRAYTATELAVYADTTPSNISMHLIKLVKAELLTVESQGRHRYYNYARPDISFAIEALANLIPKGNPGKMAITESKPVEYCRTCYDHLAGKVGVLLTDSLLKHQLIHKQNNDFEVSQRGIAWFTSVGIDLNIVRKRKRSFAKSCLDWSERRHHLSGSLGAALLDNMISNDWMRKSRNSRAVIITSKGSTALYEHFQLQA